MSKKITFILKTTLLTLFFMLEVFASGGKRNGTAGAQELLIPVGARGLAFQGAYISGITGIDAVYYNPAGLGATIGKTEAMFSYMSYIADIGVSYAALATGFEGFGTIGFSVKSLEFGDIPVTTVENPYGTGSTFSPTFVTLGFTYANALTDRISVGVNVNLITEKIVRSSATGFAFDAGVQYNGVANVEGLQLGVVVKNFGPAMSFDGADLYRQATDPNSNRGEQFYKIEGATFELPSQLELGVAYVRNFTSDYQMMVATSYLNSNFSNDEYKLAGEFGYKNMFFLRGGYSYITEAASVEEEQLFGATFGAGVNVNAGVELTVDYAYRYARFFDPNHVFSIKIGF